jgi:hypothetical protein
MAPSQPPRNPNGIDTRAGSSSGSHEKSVPAGNSDVQNRLDGLAGRSPHAAHGASWMLAGGLWGGHVPLRVADTRRSVA